MSITASRISESQSFGEGTDPLEDAVYRYGQCYDSYLVLEPDREYFWSQDRQGVIGFARVGKYLNVSGGLIAPEESKEQLLSEFLEFAESRKRVVSFYNITDADLPYFHKQGFQATKLGEEPIVDLADCAFGGKAFEWVRRQTNYCRRKGVVFRECRQETMSPEEWHGVMAELREISDELATTRPQKTEMRFLQGELDPANLGRKRIFIARSGEGEGRIEGFLVCNPGMNGDQWAFEIYRHRPNAVRGTVSFLMHQAMQALQAEGIPHVSLCLIPGMRCGQKRPGDSTLARWGLTIGTKYFGFIFDSAGMYHFKSRFRPRFESRYLCVRPKVTLGSAWAFIRLLGVLDLDLGKLARIILERMRKSVSRGTLSVSDDEGTPKSPRPHPSIPRPHLDAASVEQARHARPGRS